MRKPGEECRFDCLALARREHRQGRAQRLALLAQLDDVARIGSRLGQQLHIAAVLRFFRFSKRRRSIARERAWFMIQPSTVPFAAS